MGSCFFTLVNDLKLVVIVNFGAVIEQSWDVLHRLSWETDFDFFDECGSPWYKQVAWKGIRCQSSRTDAEH
ncbi:hypothetical protein NC653_041099 [Populus alba x Populus x berolinensis]|uniref:Uncharacterized protein n=1 Tax=Populus alba x Populus x berolinensis TaxID=444605 RepID=A0AAD6L7M8_9ROSI|nr:hypothetical protein NC653_041099 [Populus alba x Populus x berolinensis]